MSLVPSSRATSALLQRDQMSADGSEQMERYSRLLQQSKRIADVMSSQLLTNRRVLSCSQ